MRPAHIPTGRYDDYASPIADFSSATTACEVRRGGALGLKTYTSLLCSTTSGFLTVSSFAL